MWLAVFHNDVFVAKKQQKHVQSIQSYIIYSKCIAMCFTATYSFNGGCNFIAYSYACTKANSFGINYSYIAS